MHLQAHVKTLRLGAAALFVVALLLGFGLVECAQESDHPRAAGPALGQHPRKWWDVPPESVYAFTFYIWQQVQRWPTNGEEDYPRNLRALSASRRAAGPSHSRTTSTGAQRRTAATCAASTRFPAAATATTRHRASHRCPTERLDRHART